MSELYHPKGEMCLNCHNWLKGCEKLDFKSMKPLSTYVVDGVKYIEVKCSNFNKELN